jgi:hypothetical protein
MLAATRNEDEWGMEVLGLLYMFLTWETELSGQPHQFCFRRRAPWALESV